MKKLFYLLILLLMVFLLTACGGETNGDELGDQGDAVSETEEVQSEPEPIIPETAEEMLLALQSVNDNVTDILVWTEDNDPNGKLGRPGSYVGKADFSDARVEEYWTTEEEKTELGLNGGTIEVFGSEKDCNDRYEYLKQFMGADLGAFGLNQYMYKYKLVIFRVSYDLSPSNAEEYKNQMDEILNEESEIAEVE